MRELEALAIDLGLEVLFGGYRNRETRKVVKGDLLRDLIPEETYAVVDAETFAPQVLWPYLAENLDVLDEALGLRKADDVKLNRVAAIKYLTAAAPHATPLFRRAAGRRHGRDEIGTCGGAGAVGRRRGSGWPPCRAFG